MKQCSLFTCVLLAGGAVVVTAARPGDASESIDYSWLEQRFHCAVPPAVGDKAGNGMM